MIKTKTKVIFIISIIFAALPLFGAEENLNKFNRIRDEVLNFTPVYTNQYGQSIKGIDYGVEMQGAYLQKDGLGSTSRVRFDGNNFLGYKNANTVIKVMINGASRENLKFPLKDNWESSVINLGSANVSLKFETKELPVLPGIGMSKDNPAFYENTKVIFITLKVESIAKNIPAEKPQEEGWFDPGLRYDYENQIRALKNKYLSRKSLENMSDRELETLAREMSAERRAIGIKFKNATPAFLREQIYERNMKKYGDKQGPTISYLRNVQGKSWKEIIDSASKPGGGDIWYITKPSYEWGRLKSWFWGSQKEANQQTNL